jgi:hypothetical protein
MIPILVIFPSFEAQNFLVMVTFLELWCLGTMRFLPQTKDFNCPQLSTWVSERAGGP